MLPLPVFNNARFKALHLRYKILSICAVLLNYGAWAGFFFLLTKDTRLSSLALGMVAVLHVLTVISSFFHRPLLNTTDWKSASEDFYPALFSYWKERCAHYRITSLGVYVLGGTLAEHHQCKNIGIYERLSGKGATLVVNEDFLQLPSLQVLQALVEHELGHIRAKSWLFKCVVFAGTFFLTALLDMIASSRLSLDNKIMAKIFAYITKPFEHALFFGSWYVIYQHEELVADALSACAMGEPQSIAEGIRLAHVHLLNGAPGPSPRDRCVCTHPFPAVRYSSLKKLFEV